jgi:hypothetical protein
VLNITIFDKQFLLPLAQDPCLYLLPSRVRIKILRLADLSSDGGVKAR